jgi:hypothetical protein
MKRILTCLFAILLAGCAASKKSYWVNYEAGEYIITEAIISNTPRPNAYLINREGNANFDISGRTYFVIRMYKNETPIPDSLILNHDYYMANLRKLFRSRTRFTNACGDGHFNLAGAKISIVDTNIIRINNEPEYKNKIIGLKVHKKSNGKTKMLIEFKGNIYESEIEATDTTVIIEQMNRKLCQNIEKSNWYHFWFSFPYYLVKGCFYSER